MVSGRVNASGLVVAGLGFFLTRFTVTVTRDDTVREFLFAGIVPLALGLALTVLGVALTVGSFDPGFVRTAATWCLLGTGGMAVLVGLTVVGSGLGEMSGGAAGMLQLRSKAYLSNFLIGGSFGGTLTGMYAARNRQQRRELRSRTNRLVVLNRILRERVINSVTVVKAHADLLDTSGETAGVADTIRDRSDDIVETIEEVKFLTRTSGADQAGLGTVDLGSVLRDSVDALRERHPDVAVSVEGLSDEPTASDDATAVGHGPDETTADIGSGDAAVGDGSGRTPETDALVVVANDRLREVFDHLLENAVEHNDSERPAVSVTVDPGPESVRVRVSDDGPGLPDRQQAVLESGSIAEYDDPTSGFGLNIVRLIVESFDGDLSTTVTDAGTTVELAVHRPRPANGTRFRGLPGRSVGVAPARLVMTLGLGLLAGVTMGGAMQLVAGVIPVIGSLYGVADPRVGWVAHEFHSVVFGLSYAALLAVLPGRYADTATGRVAVAVAFAGALWLFAAGLVMSAWLRLLGLPAMLPNLTASSLLGHAVWGLTMGGGYHLAERFAVPERLARFREAFVPM